MGTFIAGYFKPWLIAGGITFAVVFALVVWGLLTDTEKEKYPEWEKLKFPWKMVSIVGAPVWLDDNRFAFAHEAGLLDEGAYTFPESVTVIDTSQTVLMGQPNTISVMDVAAGTVLLSQEGFWDAQYQGEGDYGNLDVSQLAEGVFQPADVSFSIDPYEHLARWYEVRPNEPVANTVLNLPGTPLLSPDGASLLIPPNVIVTLETGAVAVLFEPSAVEDHQYTSCVWHPDSTQVACTFFKYLEDYQVVYFLEILSIDDHTRLEYPLDASYLLLDWLD